MTQLGGHLRGVRGYILRSWAVTYDFGSFLLRRMFFGLPVIATSIVLDLEPPIVIIAFSAIEEANIWLID